MKVFRKVFIGVVVVLSGVVMARLPTAAPVRGQCQRPIGASGRFVDGIARDRDSLRDLFNLRPNTTRTA